MGKYHDRINWKKEHRRFFSSEGHFSEDMELIAEEFEVVEVL